MEITKGLGKLDSIVLSEYVLQNYGAMSHLKLQKLLYYIEALHLAYFDSSIIDDDFQAWLHGPVSPKLYHAVKGHSILYTEIKYVDDGKNPSEIVQNSLTNDQLEFVNDILNEYSKLTASQLETLTHEELPWIEARKGIPAGDRCENVISKDTMKSFYRKEIFPNN